MTMAALQQAGGETTGYSQENRLLQANIPLKRSNGDSLLLESFKQNGRRLVAVFL